MGTIKAYDATKTYDTIKADNTIIEICGTGFDVNVPKMILGQYYSFQFLDSMYVIERDENDALVIHEVCPKCSTE